MRNFIPSGSSRLFSAAGISLALATMTLPSPASAAAMISLPPAIYEVRVGGATSDPPGPGTFSSTHGSATIVAAPLPTLSTNIAVGDFADDTGAFLRYYFTVNGPADVLIPITLSGLIRLTASAPDTGQANSTGQIDLSNGLASSTASLEIDRGGQVHGALSELNVNLKGKTVTGGLNTITLRASSGARGSRDGGARGTAFVDPVVSIDPTFFGNGNTYTPADFSFSFSPGLGNGPAAVSGVPEPATWALLILGFGAVGMSLRQRRGPRATAKA